MLGLLILGIFVVLILLNVPISFSMGLAVSVGLLITGVSGIVVPQQLVSGIQSWTLLAVPFFILAAQIMNKGGLTEGLFDFAGEIVGSIKGGLGHANVLASMIFAGISGAAVADASGLGLVEYRAMVSSGYEKRFAVGITAASCMLGPIIPPSIMLIIYGHQAELSIASLWFAGIIPGIMTGLMLMGYIYYSVSRGTWGAPPTHPFSIRRAGKSFLRNLPILPLPFLLLWAIVSGVATPTETGIIACMYAFIVGLLYKRKEFLKNVPKVFLESAKSTATIMFIIGAATAFVWLITREQTAIMIANGLLSLTNNKYVILLIINFFLLIVGSLIEQIPAMLIIVPLLAPLAPQLGVNPIQFGIMTVFNLMIGMITPPMGMALYIMGTITDVAMKDIIVASLRFFFVLLAALLLISYIPILSTFVPNLFGFTMF